VAQPDELPKVIPEGNYRLRATTIVKKKPDQKKYEEQDERVTPHPEAPAMIIFS